MPYCPKGTFAPSLQSISTRDMYFIPVVCAWMSSGRIAIGIILQSCHCTCFVSKLSLLIKTLSLYTDALWHGYYLWVKGQGCLLAGVSWELYETGSYFEFISVIEADLYGRDHPWLEQSAEDLIGHCVCDEMKVQWVSPEKGDVDMLGFICMHMVKCNPLLPNGHRFLRFSPFLMILAGFTTLFWMIGNTLWTFCWL